MRLGVLVSPILRNGDFSEAVVALLQAWELARAHLVWSRDSRKLVRGLEPLPTFKVLAFRRWNYQPQNLFDQQKSRAILCAYPRAA